MGTGGDTATGGAASGGSAATGGAPGTGGTATGGNGSGGTGSGGSGLGGGAGSGARDGGTDGVPDAGGGGSDGSPAAALDKFRIECPCKPAAADHMSNNNCNVTTQVDRQTIVKTMGGDPGKVYDVTLHVRGLTEPNIYSGGTAQMQRFYVGGNPTQMGYTSYQMVVADPAQHYFFNQNNVVDHIHFKLDYQVTVKIRGGSKVTFEVNASPSVPDGHGVENFDMLVVPDVPPAPMWYDGQFIQLDVVSAVAQ